MGISNSNHRKIPDSNDRYNQINSENVLESTHACLSDFIPLGNRESIKLNDFVKVVIGFSQNAVNLLPVSKTIKQKILYEIGVEPFDFEKIKSIYKIGRHWISEKNRHNPNVYGECQPILRNGKFSFTIAMENNAPKKIFHYFLYHEIDHMVGYL